MEKFALALPGGYRVDPIAGMPSGGENTLIGLIISGLTWLFVIIIITALIFLIWAGIQWITSGGDKGKIETARKRITYTIIGLVVAFAAFMIVNSVASFFGVKLLRAGNAPGRYCGQASDCGRPALWECINNRCREKN